MMTFMKLFMFMSTIQTLTSLHPVKLSVILLLFSGSMFYLMAEFLSSTWFPCIFFMLFMGGILVMFMVLSSLLPNMKWPKMKMLLILMILTLLLLIYTALADISQVSTSMNLKWSMTSFMILKFATLIILGYFFSFLKILSSDNMSLRSAICP